MRFTGPGLRAASRWTVVLVVAAAGLVAATAAEAAVACSVQYQVRSQWSTGFTADVTLRNEGDPISGWTLGWAFAGNQRVANGWNGVFTQTGAQVTVRDAGWNGTLPAGGSATAGFQATYSGGNTAPTAFTVNGVACRGPNPAPSVALTSPAPGTSYTAPASIPLAATATDDGSVAKVEFYSGATLVGADTSSPYAVTWSGVPAGDYSLTAKAYDNLGAASTSAPVGVSVEPDLGPAVVATPSAVRVPEGGTATVAVRLSAQPASPVTVTTVRTSGDTDLTVASGGSLTFTTANWSAAQTVTLRAAEDADQQNGAAVLTASATGHRPARLDATEVDNDAPVYTQRFLDLYHRIKNPASGYFSPQGIPYHSVETLIVEAPDYGHVTTSEAFSYLLQLEAAYGKVTTDWKPFNDAWALMERYIIPGHADQPTNDAYNPASPATYAPELDLPSQYPAQLDFAAPVGQDPLAAELKSAYGTSDVYGMHWLLDVDNRYGYGRCGDGTTKPSYINTFQRGPQESVWETIPQPSCDTFAHGGRNGYLDLFTGDASYAKQWKYTNAPDADARAVQSAYWALTWAKEQGKASAVSSSVANAAKMGDYLRYSFFDKYFKKIGNCVDIRACADGTGKDSSHYLLSWYYAWGGALDTAAPWAWRIGDGAAHQGYQNPLAAWALSNVNELKPRSATGAADWARSLERQLEFYRWLQSADGGIAGGATNSWDGRYNTPPAGSPTFYGMFYDQQPVWHDPPSNQWFGFQVWSMQRVAEYYQVTGDAKAKAVLDKWVPWAIANTTFAANGTFAVPDTLQWTGRPDTWNPASPGANAGLRVSVVKWGNDVGVAAALARTLTYYAARSGNVAARNTARALLDGAWNNHQDSRGLAVPETRADYDRFDDAVVVPPGWTGTMANGDPINSSSTFVGIRSWYRTDPNWSKVDSYLKGGPAPTITYHRFWAQADMATAMADFGRLFP